MSENPEFVIRKGKASDCKEILDMSQGLADFQKKGFLDHIPVETLERDGFGTNPPLFYVFVAHLPGDDKLIGYALYVFKYSTRKGKSMLLEDLYCVPEYRAKHVGSALFQAVIKEAILTDCYRMDFEVLEWNPARKFYESFGACDITERDSWHLYRMEREDLEKVAAKSRTKNPRIRYI